MDRSRTEERLLSLLRTEPRGSGVVEVGEMSRTDWEDLLRTSALHGVTPLLYHRLTTFHTGIPIPAEVVRELRCSYLRNAGRNMHLYHELGKVLGRLRQADIPVIALKGAHLAEAVYGNIALRPMNDVDLLVQTEDGLVTVQTGGLRAVDEASEKLGISVENEGESSSVAKAGIDSAGIMRRLKPPPPSDASFSPACEDEPTDIS